MTSMINTNIASFNIHRTQSMTESSLLSTIQRLSSGTGVNRAKDDAAGLANSDALNLKIKHLTVLEHNANEAISLVQTAASALEGVGENLQRMRELALEATNPSNTESDNQKLNDEYKELLSELTGDLKDTTFNGQPLFRGSGGSAAGDASSSQATSAPLILTYQVAHNGTRNYLEDQISISLKDLTNNPAISALATSTVLSGGAAPDARAAIDAAQATFTSAKAELDELFANGSTMTASALATSARSLQQNIDNAQSALDAAIADPAAQTAAQKSIKDLDNAINLISMARGEFGAVQKEFGDAISRLDVSRESDASSSKSIMDADLAKESADLSHAQILQQANTAMLTQANSLPQTVLSLLR